MSGGIGFEEGRASHVSLPATRPMHVRNLSRQTAAPDAGVGHRIMETTWICARAACVLVSCY
jgi:hypothetical protein